MILTKNIRKGLVNKIKGYIKSPAYIKMFIGILLNAALKYLDKNYGEKVPSKFIDDIQDSVKYFIAEDWENLTLVVPNVINDLVDIPGLDEDMEGKLFTTIIKAIFEFMQYLGKKNLK